VNLKSHFAKCGGAHRLVTELQKLKLEDREIEASLYVRYPVSKKKTYKVVGIIQQPSSSESRYRPYLGILWRQRDSGSNPSSVHWAINVSLSLFPLLKWAEARLGGICL
jgi:hypothetical protein